MREPVLTIEDRRIWAQWERLAIAHSRTTMHARRVDDARRHYDSFIEAAAHPYLAFSGGKDSCALLALAYDAGWDGPTMWVSTDFDFPDEADHVTRWGHLCGVKIETVRGNAGMAALLQEDGGALDDHSPTRESAVEQATFFGPIDAYRERRGTDGVLLGLRKDESRGRLMNRAKRGCVYWVASRSEWVGAPLSDWRGIDVYAYVLSRGLPLHDVYRCVRLAESPDRVRMDGWMPGEHAQRGAMIWLKTYYPSLFRRLTSILPDAQRLA